MAAAAKKPTEAPDQADLAAELVGIHLKHRDDLGRADEIKTLLKQIATDQGENFQEVVAGKGKVSVSGKKGSRFKGTVPEVDPEKFLALTKCEQNQLIKAGLVRMVDQYTNPYYGAVEVKLF